MAKKKLGEKYVCYQCGCKFYDLSRPQPICPKCGAMYPYVQQWFMTPRNIIADMPEYYDRGMGKGENGQGVHIRGRKHRRDEMRERGLTEAGDESELKKSKELLAEHEDRKRSRS